MVTTRRQEQLLHTPPAAGRGSFADASPATPADGSGPPPTARLPLKSALKQKRLAADGWEEDGTPVDAGIKKRVRIHSSNNMVRIFSTSHSALSPQDSPQGHGVHSLPLSHSDDDGTPQSGRPRRRRPPPRKSPLAVRLLARAFGWRSSRRSSSSSESLVLGVLFTLSWMAASSALIFANKRLMVDAGFRFPFALTAMGQATSTLLAFAACVAGVAPLRPPPSSRAMLTKLLPVSLSFAASLFLGNVAYLGLSVAFINIMKAATPVVTLTLGLALGLERLSLGTLAATVMIAAGTAAATASEADSDHFHWLAFVAFALSVVFEGVRVVMTEKLLGQARYNVMEALVYLGPFTACALALGAVVFELPHGLATHGWALLCERPGQFASATAISFLVNLFCYLAITHIAATSFKVAGCLKNVLVVWGGIAQGDVVTPRELQGYAISLAGFLLFSASRWHAAARGVGISDDSPSPRKKRR